MGSDFVPFFKKVTCINPTEIDPEKSPKGIKTHYLTFERGQKIDLNNNANLENSKNFGHSKDHAKQDEQKKMELKSRENLMLVKPQGQILQNEFEEVTCNECKGTFATKIQLEVHNNLVHLKIKPPYTCNYCDRSFSLKSRLEAHANIVHLNLKTYNCDLCDSSYLFESKSNLKAHVIGVHSNSKKYQGETNFDIDKHAKQELNENSSLNGHLKQDEEKEMELQLREKMILVKPQKQRFSDMYFY